MWVHCLRCEAAVAVAMAETASGEGGKAAGGRNDADDHDGYDGMFVYVHNDAAN
jgi:hypothetical protein